MHLLNLVNRDGALNFAARILAIDCIVTLLIASTLFKKVAHRTAFGFLRIEELPVFAGELPVFGFADLLSLFTEFLLEPFAFAESLFVLADAVALLDALFARTCVTGASRIGAATFNACPICTVLDFK